MILTITITAAAAAAAVVVRHVRRGGDDAVAVRVDYSVDCIPRFELGATTRYGREDLGTLRQSAMIGGVIAVFSVPIR
jgi:hypothetical protein